MALPPVLSKIIEWLRAGYPEGVPDVDYIPLFALLGSQLTNDEVSVIADELAQVSKPDSAEAIRKAIGHVTDHKPTDADETGSGPGWPPKAGPWPSRPWNTGLIPDAAAPGMNSF